MSKIELYPHNQRAYIALVEMLAARGKACVIQPTGTGKSFIGMQYVLDHPNQRILWVTPSDYIRAEQVRAYKKAGLDSLPDNLRYATYQKLMAMAQREDDFPQADCIVLDEFHHVGAPEWSKGIEALLTENPNAKLIGFSATAIRWSDGLRNMADETFGGNVAHESTLANAWLTGILPIPTYVTALYDADGALVEIKKRIERIRDHQTKIDINEKYEQLRRALQDADGLDLIFKKYLKTSHPKLLVFCKNKQHLEELMLLRRDWFRSVNREVHAYKTLVGYSKSTQEYEKFVQDDSDAVRVLYSIDQLNEGVHIDGIDGIVMVRPTESPTVYQQQLGRALEASSNRAAVVFDLVNNFNSVGGSLIATSLEEEHVHIQRKGGGDTEVYRPDAFRIFDEVADPRELVKEIELACDTTTSIDEKIDYLEQWVKEHGVKLDGTPYIEED